jgi:hypothetical protein
VRARVLILISITAALFVAPAVASAATITVNTTDDVNAAQCTLRSAITAANSNSVVGGCVTGVGSDTIKFNLPANSTITLGTALPAITSAVDIQGPGADQLTVDGGNGVRVVGVTVNGSTTISGLTIAHGKCVQGCGLQNAGGTVKLDHVIVDHNVATQSGGTNAFPEGGGIFNQGTMTLTLSTVSNNTVSASGASSQNVPRGGGVLNANGGSLTVDRSTLVGNTATASGGGGSFTNAAGGGISNFATLNVAQSAIDGNVVHASGGTVANTAQGGGISNANSASVHVSLDRATIAENSATGSGPGIDIHSGGLVVDGASFAITSSTIASNSAPMYANLSGSATTVRNSIVANPLGGGASCSSHPTSQGYNVDSGTSCGFNQATDKPSTNPMLDSGGIADNGGPTKTIALQPGSPAIDQGLSSAGETADQRGSSRPSDFGSIANATGGDGSDIGAFEVQDTTPPPASPPAPPADATAPDTSIASGPADGSLVAKADPAFSLVSDDPSATFECSIDGSQFAACSSPKAIGPLADGRHTFAVRAVDAARNEDQTPAARTFTVDTKAPNTTLVKPVSKTTRRTLKLRFASSEPGSRFLCKLDRKAYKSCASPLRTRKLAFGRHTLKVRAIDRAGNQDATPAQKRFRVVRPRA